MLTLAILLNLLPAYIQHDDFLEGPLVPLRTMIKSPDSGVLRFYSSPFGQSRRIVQVGEFFYEITYRSELEVHEAWFPFESRPMAQTEVFRILEEMRSHWSDRQQRQRSFRGILFRDIQLEPLDYLSIQTALSQGIVNFDPRDLDLQESNRDEIIRWIGIGSALAFNGGCAALVLRVLGVF